MHRWCKNQSKPSGGLDGLYGEEDGSGDPLLRENSQEFAAVDVQYPYVERCLRRHFKRQVRYQARYRGQPQYVTVVVVVHICYGCMVAHVVALSGESTQPS